jgi:5-(carboxyamino)imidazole ribonucleotide mutase
MPGGVPVATVGINQAKNAGILAAQIIGTSDVSLQKRILAYKKQLEAISKNKNQKLKF